MAKTPTPVNPVEKKTEDKIPDQAPLDPPAQEPTKEVAADEVAGTIPARILVDHGKHRCNTLALLTEAEAANCAEWADTSDAAVEYIASQTDPVELEKLKAVVLAAAKPSN